MKTYGCFENALLRGWIDAERRAARERRAFDRARRLFEQLASPEEVAQVAGLEADEQRESIRRWREARAGRS